MKRGVSICNASAIPLRSIDPLRRHTSSVSSPVDLIITPTALTHSGPNPTPTDRTNLPASDRITKSVRLNPVVLKNTLSFTLTNSTGNLYYSYRSLLQQPFLYCTPTRHQSPPTSTLPSALTNTILLKRLIGLIIRSNYHSCIVIINFSRVR